VIARRTLSLLVEFFNSSTFIELSGDRPGIALRAKTVAAQSCNKWRKAPN